VRLRDDMHSRDFEDGSIALEDLAAAGGEEREVAGWWHDDVWDFIRLLPDELRSDLESIAAARDARSDLWQPPSHATVIGDAPVMLLGGSERPTIEPHVVLDASSGPIVVERGAVVHAFTRLVGPCYVGRQVTVMGGDISVCSIGPVCKVRGEMSNTIMLAYANKGHDGFIGHSYVARWVNIGASTVTSNLKNTYGSVSLWTPQGIRDTGMQFLGTLFGDHAKTGIGLRLTTGTVLGAGANVYDRMPPKAVPPFSWGGGPPYSLYRVDKFIETAVRMMSRRHVSLSDRARRHWSTVHANRWALPISDDATRET
jgi:UDP-N-acetylglucosamine diphosphorylase/glucosamine-1-phosphate N-acetyltransferase